MLWFKWTFQNSCVRNLILDSSVKKQNFMECEQDLISIMEEQLPGMPTFLVMLTPCKSSAGRSLPGAAPVPYSPHTSETQAKGSCQVA